MGHRTRELKPEQLSTGVLWAAQDPRQGATYGLIRTTWQVVLPGVPDGTDEKNLPDIERIGWWVQYEDDPAQPSALAYVLEALKSRRWIWRATDAHVQALDDTLQHLYTMTGGWGQHPQTLGPGRVHVPDCSGCLEGVHGPHLFSLWTDAVTLAGELMEAAKFFPFLPIRRPEKHGPPLSWFGFTQNLIQALHNSPGPNEVSLPNPPNDD